MSGTPPSARKRPQCRKCGTSMAGHRRVSGRYVCPNEDDDVEPTTPPPRFSTRLNSRDRQTPQPPPSTRPTSAKRERTASPAPTVMSDEYHKTEDESYDTENDIPGSLTPRQKRPSKIGPTESLGVFRRLSTPLASIFIARRSDIKEFQQEAGRRGLYTGTVYKPRKLKEEESQRWMVMGRDPVAVDQLVDFQRQDVVRQLELESPTTKSAPVPGAGPVNVICNGPSFSRLFIASICAIPFLVLVAFYVMAYL